MTDRDDAHLLSGAYALNAVTPEEAELVEAAMRESEELRSEVVGLSDTAVALGLGLPPMAPPPALRNRVLDAIDALPQEAPEPSALPAATAVPAGAHVAPRRRRRLRPMAALALAASAVVLFGGGFLVQRTLLEPQSAYTAIVAAADVRSAEHIVAGGGTAVVSWSESEHGTAVELKGVDVPSGKVLQLWSVRGSVITSAGLYEDGAKYAVLTGTPSPDEGLAVSVEPDGGSAHPTTVPIVTVPLTT